MAAPWSWLATRSIFQAMPAPKALKAQAFARVPQEETNVAI